MKHIATKPSAVLSGAKGAFCEVALGSNCRFRQRDRQTDKNHMGGGGGGGGLKDQTEELVLGAESLPRM